VVVAVTTYCIDTVFIMQRVIKLSVSVDFKHKECWN